MNFDKVLKKRHQFKSFSRQIADINADIKTDFSLTITSPGDSETSTFFYSTLLETLHKNFDVSYTRLTKDLLPLSRTIHLILHNKEKIFSLIIEYLRCPLIEISGGLENVMKLISMLARDLGQDFYPYFNDIFMYLTNLFAPKDAGFVDNFFKCICFLLKFLSKYLIQDIENVLSLFVTMYFNHELEFARRLGSQSLAYLIRQSQHKKSTHKRLFDVVKSFIEGKSEEDVNKIVVSLGLLYYYEIKNVAHSLWSNSAKLIKSFIPKKEQFVYDAFLRMIESVANHVNTQHAQSYITALADTLPTIDSTLCFKTFIVLMNSTKTPLFQNSTMLLSLLKDHYSETTPEVVCDFLEKLNDFKIPESDFPTISEVIIAIVDNSNVAEIVEKLKNSHKISSICSQGIIKYANTSFDKALPNLKLLFDWSHPDPSSIPDSLIQKANKAFKKNRDVIVPLLSYIHNAETYKILKPLKDLTLIEQGVRFTLMAEFEPEQVISQPPLFIKSIGDDIQTEEALKIIQHLINVCYRFQPDWLKTESDVFQTLLNKIDFNTSNLDIPKIASSILVTFFDSTKPIEMFNGDELIVHTANTVLNIIISHETLRPAESLIVRLSDSIEKIRNIEKLLNVAFALARVDYRRFREYDAQLIGNIIKFDPQKYGPEVTNELSKSYPWKDENKLFFNTLLQGIQKGQYIDQTIIDLIVRFCSEGSSVEEEANIVLLLDTLPNIIKDENIVSQVEKIGYLLLKSISDKVRTSAFNLVFNLRIVGNRKLNEQQRERIRETLYVFVKGENIQVLIKFFDFLEEYKFERPFIAEVATNLTIGVAHEFLSEKRRQKHKFTQLASNILQALALLESEEVAPLVQSFLVENPTASDYRRFPKFFIPMISRIPHHLPNFLPQIIDFLRSALRQSSNKTRELKNAMNAASLFFESFADFSEFANDCLTVLERALNENEQSAIRLTTAIANQFPNLFADHQEVVTKIIVKLREQTSGEIINIISRIVTQVPKRHEEIIAAFKEVLGNTKLFKREQIWQSFIIFLSFMKESFATAPFRDLLITFLVKYQRIEAIPITHGIELTKEQFSGLSTLIAYPLDESFREALIPLIAESLGEYAEPFIKLNNDDINEKAITYKSLDSAGDFAFIFALQSFADLQLNNFSLRSAAVGFVSRVIQHTPSIVDEYILPAVKFHVKKQNSRIPPNEILMILRVIVKTIPDILPSIRRLSAEPYFVSLGSFDSGIREDSLVKLTEFIKSYDDWNVDEIGEIFFPLLCQISTTPGIEEALSILCKYATESALKTLLRRLIRGIDSGKTIHLLVALCKAQAFPPDSITPALLNIITDKKKPPKLQLRLISALLGVNKSANVVHKLIGSMAPRLSSKKDDKRKIGQETLTELVLAMNSSDYFLLFQDLRNFLTEGRQIPVLFMSLNNLLRNSTKQNAFDNFIPLISELLLEDIFGYMGQMRAQKAVEIPEAKRCMSFNTFELLAKNITFGTHSKDLVNTLLKRFKLLTTIEQAHGAKRLIQSIADGFVENVTVDAKTLVDTVCNLLNMSDNIKKEEEDKKKRDKNYVPYGRAYEKDFFIEKPVRDEMEDGNQIAKRLGNNYLVSLMAVRFLFVFFERDLFDVEDEKQVELLESLLDRLWEFIKRAQDTETLVVSLSILQHYIELPSFSKFLPDVMTFLTTTIARLKSAADVFGKAVFSLLTSVLTKYEELELPTSFTRALVSFCGGQLDVHDSCGSVFGILKLVMMRRKDIPEIYDLVQPALELCIRAFSPQIRKLSALFVSQFMTTYEMSQIVFKKRLQFALGNLSSPKVTARRSLLTFFSHFIVDSTELQLDPYSELILAHLGARVANETDERVAPKLRKVIGNLLTNVSGSRFLSMWNLMVKWASTAGKQVRTGLLLLAVSVEHCSEAMANLVDALQQIVNVHIESENNKVKIAATELHKHIVAAYPGNESTKLLSVQQTLNLIVERETTKVGCEILHWYLSEFESTFTPNDFEMSEIADCALNVIVSWGASIKEASEILFSVIVRVSTLNCIEFFNKNIEKLFSAAFESPKVVVSLMRVFVQIAIRRCAESDDILKWTLSFISKATDDQESKKSAEKALELLRHKVDIDLFTKVWTEILEDNKERKQKEEIERQVEEELEPEEYQKRVLEEKEKKKEKERRKKYLTQGDEHGTLYPYGPDGKRVESVPLAPEFR